MKNKTMTIGQVIDKCGHYKYCMIIYKNHQFTVVQGKLIEKTAKFFDFKDSDESHVVSFRKATLDERISYKRHNSFNLKEQIK